MAFTCRSLVLEDAVLLSAFTAVAVPPAHVGWEHGNSLVTWYHWGLKDNFFSVTANGDATARSTGYTWVRGNEALVLREPTDTRVQTPLVLSCNTLRGDYVSTVTTGGLASALNAGYVRKDVREHVWTDHAPGTVPLHPYWNADRQDNVAAASPRTSRRPRGRAPTGSV
ncbi:hypothetical protein ACIRJO_37790 [Streptomyces sp. NPDC102394]|uniref:hypothetical protein n=1 Tax=Streptomyces sp. NPDC102394 TaxID=3366167 RepID=UPI0037F7B017